MAIILTQTDSTTTFNVACSARTAGATTSNHTMGEGATAGTVEFEVDPGNNGTNQAVLEMETSGGLGGGTT